MPEKIAILGLGWLGLPLAKSLYKDGYQINGSTTSSEKLMTLLQSQFSVRIIKVEQNMMTGNWKAFSKGISTLIINIPPKRVPDIEEIYPAQIQQIAQKCPEDLNVIFVSSTAVYGNHNHVVNEETSTQPTKKSGVAVLAAENIIRNHFKENATIVRLAGLVGPERHPGRFLSSKTERLSNPKGKVNLIHQEDCISLISEIIKQKRFGEIFNGCSDKHPTRKDFYTKAAYLLSLTPPQFSDKVAPFKEVDNQKSKIDLGMVYKFPDPESMFD